MHRALALALVLLTLPAVANAQSIIKDRSDHTRPADLSLLGLIPLPFGFGFGMRFGIPIAHDGFIGSINDAVFIEPGAQFIFWTDFNHDRLGIQVPVLMRWDFFLTRDWTVFGSVGPVFGFYFDDGGGGGGGHGGGRFRVEGDEVFRPAGPPGFFGIVFGGGAFYNFSQTAALRLDASTRMLGVGILLRL